MSKIPRKGIRSAPSKALVSRQTAVSSDFDEVLRLIDAARVRAVAAVNTTLIDLYWSIGEYISRNLFQMRQFHETYRGNEKVSALLTQLPWTHHLLILSKSKRPEEREFYLRMAATEKWKSRELERQLNSALFERVVLSPTKVSPPLRQLHPDAASIFKDSYVVEFLNLPPEHSEADLHRGLVEQLKKFLIELGRDFCYIGSHFPVQVGGRDFELDLMFFNRALNCLVAFELKVVEFEPEYLGKLEFYLEALDRDVKKPHEQPSIGVLLCATKDQEVVEYALSRAMSPALVAEYQTRLPDKKLLQAKLHEFYALAESQAEETARGETTPRPTVKLPAAQKPRKRRKK